LKKYFITTNGRMGKVITMNNEWISILSLCASSALGVIQEPRVYAPLRLMEVLEKLLRFGEQEHITADARLSEIADMISERKLLCMSDETAFQSLLQEVAFSLVDIVQHQGSTEI